MGAMKPYKIQDFTNNRGRRVGMTACSLADLKKRITSMFRLRKGFVLRLESDGTEVSDEGYFASLPSQTVFVITNSNQEWHGHLTYLKLATSKAASVMASQSADVINDVREHLCRHDSPEMLLMMEYVNSLESNLEAEDRDSDPAWFEGLPKTIDTKDNAMKASARSRIRSYLNKAKEFINNSELSSVERQLLDDVMVCFRKELKSVHYYEEYFSRIKRGKVSLCDSTGWFTCDGRYNEEACTRHHVINPYSTRDSRVLFSTWNLDHRIEKTREVLPSLLRIAQQLPRGKAINWRYFYALLFTRDNLKLVDIRCHLKERHEGFECDRRKFYVKATAGSDSSRDNC